MCGAIIYCSTLFFVLNVDPSFMFAIIVGVMLIAFFCLMFMDEHYSGSNKEVGGKRELILYFFWGVFFYTIIFPAAVSLSRKIYNHLKTNIVYFLNLPWK